MEIYLPDILCDIVGDYLEFPLGDKIRALVRLMNTESNVIINDVVSSHPYGVINKAIFNKSFACDCSKLFESTSKRGGIWIIGRMDCLLMLYYISQEKDFYEWYRAPYLAELSAPICGVIKPL